MPDFCPLFQGVGGWLITLIAMIGGVLLLIDMARHAFSERRDYRAAGLEALGLVGLIVIGSQASAIMITALGWMGVAASCTY